MDLTFSPMLVTIGDMKAFQNMTGHKWSTYKWNLGEASAEELGAVYYLVMRQNDPEFSIDAVDAVTFQELVDVYTAIGKSAADPQSGSETSS